MTPQDFHEILRLIQHYLTKINTNNKYASFDTSKHKISHGNTLRTVQ